MCFSFLKYLVNTLVLSVQSIRDIGTWLWVNSEVQGGHFNHDGKYPPHDKTSSGYTVQAKVLVLVSCATFGYLFCLFFCLFLRYLSHCDTLQ